MSAAKLQSVCLTLAGLRLSHRTINAFEKATANGCEKPNEVAIGKGLGHGLSHPCLTENVLRQKRDLSCLTHPYKGETETRVSPEAGRERQSNFVLTLRPLTTGWCIPVEVRLRALLKRALRSYGLKCLGCRPVAPEQPEVAAARNIEGTKEFLWDTRP
jgi:hypothetical protein